MKFVDIDGHILEPPDLWKENLEPEYRDRAMQFKKDEEGLDYWVIDGQVHGKLVKSTSANLATIGKSAEWRKEHIFEKHDVSYEDGRAMAPGACDPDERVKLMDQEGIDASFLFPSLGLSWMGTTEDPGLAAAYCRVYNDWIIDFCNAQPGRLYPCVLLPWTDVGESVKELKRTSGQGSRAVMVPSLPPGGRGLWAELLGPLVGRVPGAGSTFEPASIFRGDEWGEHSVSRFQDAKLVDLRDQWRGPAAGVYELLPGIGVRPVSRDEGVDIGVWVRVDAVASAADG